MVDGLSGTSASAGAVSPGSATALFAVDMTDLDNVEHAFRLKCVGRQPLFFAGQKERVAFQVRGLTFEGRRIVQIDRRAVKRSIITDAVTNVPRPRVGHTRVVTKVRMLFRARIANTTDATARFLGTLRIEIPPPERPPTRTRLNEFGKVSVAVLVEQLGLVPAELPWLQCGFVAVAIPLQPDYLPRCQSARRYRRFLF